MPKEIKSYQCKFCGVVHPNIERAISCEDSHVHAEAIDKEIYNFHSTIPNALDIKMSDGSVVQYSLGGGTIL